MTVIQEIETKDCQVVMNLAWLWCDTISNALA